VDALYAQVFRKLLTRMAQDPARTHWVTRVQAVAKYLERIGDHATNLAEMVVFMIKGKDIRHVGRLEEERSGPAPHGVLLLCVHNAARSQMAEGWARKMFPPSMRIWSAGSDPAAQVHPLAIRAMREVGIDIAWQQPKRISEVPLGDVDTVITLCAEEVCVDLPSMMRRETWALPDPVPATGTEEERLDAFRQVRDWIGERLRAWLHAINIRVGNS
jgi:arsenate reductase